MATKTLNIGIDSKQAVSGAEQISKSLKDIQAQAAATIKSVDAMDASFARLKASAGNLNSMLGTIGVNANFTRVAAGVGALEQGMLKAKSATSAATAEIERMERVSRAIGTRPTIRPTVATSAPSRVAPAQTNLVMPRPTGVAGFNAEVEKGVKSSQTLESSFNSLTRAAGGLNGILATLGLSAGFTQMVTTMATFEKKMSGVKAVTKASAEEMDRLEKAARKLGATTSFSATQAAEGMGILGSAGLSTSQIISGLESVLNLADAGAMELAKAADIAGSVMGGFGLQATDMGMIADTLAGASVAGALNVQNLGESMKTAAPLARALGMSLQETSAAFVLLSNSGIKGEAAASAFNGILASIISPTKQAEKDIARLGISFDDISPKTNNFTQIMQKLAKANLDSQAAVDLFGREGVAAILTFARSSDELKKVTGDMNKLEGEAKRIATVMGDNLAGDWQNLTGAAEELTLVIGEAGMLGALRSITQTATGVVRVMAGMGNTLGDQEEYYTNLTKVIEALAVTVGTVYAGRALGALITRGAEAVTSQIALATATTAAARATAAATAVEAASATAAVARAQANVAGAQAALQMAIAQDKGTGAMVAQRAAAAQLAAANATLLAAKSGATAAEAAHGAAIAATTVRARAASAAMRVLSTSMAFFGGPIGLAITALGAAIYYLQQRTTEAAKQQVVYNERLEKLKNINAELASASGTRRTELENERKQILANADAEYELAKARLEGLKAFQASGQKTFVDSLDSGLKKLDQAMGFKGAGVNDAVEAAGSIPGMGMVGKVTGLSVGDMKLDTTDKQIADVSASIAQLEKDRASLRTEAGKAIPALVSPGAAAGAGVKKPGAGDDAKESGKSRASIKDTQDKTKAFEDLLVRYGDETSAIEQQSNAYGKSSQEIDKLTAQYVLFNAAREAGLHTDDNVLASIEMVSSQYAASKQRLRDLEDAEKAKNAAMEESARVTAAAATPLEEYQARLARLKELMQQYIDTNGEVGISQETFNRSVEALNKSMNSEGQQIFDATRTSAEQYEIELSKLREQLELYIQTNGAAGISQDTFNRALEKLQQTVGSTTPELDNMARSIPTISAAFDQAASGALYAFEDALVDIVTGTKSAREAFADMAKSIAADLARMAIRMAIIQPLAMMLGGGFGGGMAMAAAPAFGGFASSASVGPISWAHSGGVLGTDSLRQTNPFAGIPKFHTGGLASNETPAILQKGEGVFTRGQMAALAPVNNNSSSAPVTINVSVNQSQGGDPGAAENQGRIIAKHVEMAMGEYLQKQQRPGGQLNPNGGY